MKRLISFLLATCMLLTMLPATVLAAEWESNAAARAEAKAAENPFTDVRKGDWYYDAVQYARVNNFFKGTTDTTFDPYGTMTRGMFVTVLGRMAGVDTTDYIGKSTFSDVPVSMYYAPYIEWAYKHGITDGIGGGKFSPNTLINREQMAVFFVRYFEKFGVDYETGANITTTPKDLSNAASWAQDAIMKLWKQGLLNGDGVNFNPKKDAARAETATLCMRTDKTVDTWYSEPGVASDRVSVDPANPDAGKTDEDQTDDDKPQGGLKPVVGGNTGSGGTGGDTTVTTKYEVTFGLVSSTDQDMAAKIKLPGTDGKALYDEGTKIEYLPAPTMQGGLFMGWYYDPNMNRPVPAGAEVNGNIELYAKMGTVNAVSAEETPNYITVEVGAGQDYSFRLVYPQGQSFSASDLTFINVSANNQELTHKTDAGNLQKYDEDGKRLYQYKVAADGTVTFLLEGGQTYRVELAENCPAVFAFVEPERAEHIRVLNIITEKEEVKNYDMATGIRYIPWESLTGDKSPSLSGLFTLALNTNNNDTSVEAVDQTGTFEFDGQAQLSDNSKVDLQVGDTVAIYKGVRPDKRELTDDAVAALAAEGVVEDPNGTIAYVEITEIENGVCSYKTAESEDVLFTPDILPLLMPENYNPNASGGTIFPAIADMTYIDEVYEQMGLDAQTTVDVGDYIIFYLMGQSGEIGEDSTSAGYAKITGVTVQGDKYKIDYVNVSEAEAMAAMDVYESRNEAIVPEDVEKIEAEMVQQAWDSGFVDEAAAYLTALALETDGFKEAAEDLDMDLSSYNIIFSDGTPVDEETMELMGVSASIDKDRTKVSADVASGKLVHFEDGTGLRAELVMSFVVVVDCGEGDTIDITLQAIFEQEVMLTINVSGGAVWKKAWIFPYIADYRMNANLDVGTFTGIGITATVETKAAEKEEEAFDWKPVTNNKAEAGIINIGDKLFSASNKIKEIGDQIEEQIDKAEHFLDIPTVDVPSKGLDGEDFESEGNVETKSLQERYSEMMENAEENWIDIVRVEIFASEGHVDPLHILCYGISADFVVSATMYVTIGMTFEYGVAKRYNFSLMLFSRKTTNETIDLEEAHYEFQFYVMGTLGIRAGIEFEIAMGLFSLKLDSIGIAAEVGAYARLWGYFFYYLKGEKVKNEETGKEEWQTDSDCSGALYIEIGLYLSISFKAQLFSSDKLTYNPTLYENEWPLWSAGSAEDVYDFYYPESPEDVDEDDFKDEESGKVDTDAYEAEVEYVTALLNMEIENATRFTLPTELFDMNFMDMKTGDMYGSEGEDEETIVPGNFDSNVNDNGHEKHYFIELSNPKFSYNPATNVITVETNELKETCEVTITWRDGTLAFSTKPITRTVNITWENSEDARFINFDPNGGSGGAFISKRPVPAGEQPTEDDYLPEIEDPTRLGYIFKGWVNEDGSDFTIPETMPNYAAILPNQEKGITVYAKWQARADMPYTVKHYLEELGGRYVLADELKAENLPADYVTGSGIEEKADGVSDRLTEVAARTYEGFTAKPFEQQIVKTNGSTVVEIYYSRNTYTTTFNYGSCAEDGSDFTGDNDPVIIKSKLGGTVLAPNLYLKGYVFQGFGLTEDQMEDGIFVTGNSTYTAAWKLDDDTTYRIERYVERNDKPGSYMLAAENAIITAPGDVKEPVTIASLEEAKLNEVGIEFKEIRVNGNVVNSDITIAADGSTVIKLYHDRIEYGLTFDYNGGKVGENTSATQQVKYGTKVTAPADEAVPEKVGYTFDGWYTEDGTDGDWGKEVNFDTFTMPAEATTVYAKWVEGTDTAYTVEHYLQDVTGEGYTHQENKDDSLTGTTNAEIDISKLDKLTIPGAAYSYAMVGDTRIEGDVKATINENGDTVVKLYYDRATYTVTFDINGGTGTAPEAQTIRHEGKVTAVDGTGFSKPGYSFAGWVVSTAENADAWNFETGTITAPRTLYAKWTAKGDTAYTVNYYYMDLNGQYGAAQPEVKNDGVTDQTVNVAPAEKEGFTLNSERSTLSGIVTADGNLVLSVYYDRNQYDVTFDFAGGENGEKQTSVTEKVYYGAAITAPEGTLTRHGYDFAETWTGVGEAPAIGGTMPAGNVSYNADWTPWTYTVKFHANTNASYEGTVADQTFNYDETKALSSDSFTRPGSGYTMTGWNTEADGTGTGYNGGDQVNFSEAITEKNQTIDLYAVWQQGASTTYTVKYYKMNVDGNGYTEDETLRQTPNGIVGANVSVAPTAPTGFELNDSESNLSGMVAAGGALVLEVYYDRIQYNVTVDKADGNATVTTQHYYGAEVTVPAAPTKTGHNFRNWSDGNAAYAPGATFTMGAANVTLTAQWDAATYIVSFDANMDGVSNPADQTATFGKTYGNLPVLSKDGYTFEGWFTAETDGTQVKADTVVTEPQNHTLYAYWASNEYTITFVTGVEGVVVDPITQNYGTTVELPTPTHSDAYKEFKGWYYDEACTQAVGENFTMPKGGATLYAKWGVRTYTVTLNPGSYADDQTPRTVTVEHDGTYPELYTPTTTNPFYQFAGWDPNPSGFTLNYIHEGDKLYKNGDHGLAGAWNKKTIQVSFDLNGGEMNASYNNSVSTQTKIPASTTSTDYIVYLPAAPEKAGYTFQGWKCSIDGVLYEASSGSDQYATRESYNVIRTETAPGAGEDVTFTAQWKLDEYTIYIYQNEYVVDGSNTVAQTIEGYSINYGNGGAFTLPALDKLPEGQVIEKWKFHVQTWMNGDRKNSWNADAGAVGETLTFEKMVDNTTLGSPDGDIIILHPQFAHPLKYIDTIEELQQLSALYEDNNTTEISKLPDTIYLNDNIALPSGGWVAIGKNTNFNRNFDGQGHTITMASGTFQPIFHVINADKTVKNLNVKVSGVTADPSLNYWGVIAYQLSGKLNNCKVIGAGTATTENPHITANGEHWYVGILAGYVNGSGADITDCYVMGESDDSPLYAKLTSTVDNTRTVYIGGMVGWLSNGTMNFSGAGPYARANITISRAITGSYSYGGIVGMQENSTSCKINGNSENPALFYITTNLQQGAYAVSQNAKYVYNVKVYTLDNALSVRYDSTGTSHVTEE